jgi:hypothetical protein
MIVAEQKKLDEIKAILGPYQRILVLGCGTCVTVCFAGGEKEVGILASTLRMAFRLDGQEKTILEATVQRQCEYEYNAAIQDKLKNVDLVLSLACGIGVQTPSRAYGLNDARLAAPAFWTGPAASAPSPAVPRACSTDPAAARQTASARSPKMWSAPGSSSTTASRA